MLSGGLSSFFGFSADVLSWDSQAGFQPVTTKWFDMDINKANLEVSVLNEEQTLTDMKSQPTSLIH